MLLAVGKTFIFFFLKVPIFLLFPFYGILEKYCERMCLISSFMKQTMPQRSLQITAIKFKLCQTLGHHGLQVLIKVLKKSIEILSIAKVFNVQNSPHRNM